MKPRRFPVPASARDALLGAAATVDEIDLAATRGNDWAGRVLVKENQRILASLCESDPRLPYGVVVSDQDDLIVTGLLREGKVWHGGEWLDAGDEPLEAVPLDADEVAFVARAVMEGCHAVVLKGYTPVAFVSAAPPAADGADGHVPLDAGADVPEGAKVLAVVDDLDRDAVLDLVAVLPGPKVLRRHDGVWQDDPAWVQTLRSVKPPPVVVLDEAQIAAVVPQIDDATHGTPFVKEPPKKATAASAYDQRADEMAIEFAVLAAGMVAVAGKGTAMPGGLQRYWLAGEGAAKIRWGTPGAMTRCHRHLMKYLGSSDRAYRVCNNISKKLGGKGVAWDVD